MEYRPSPLLVRLIDAATSRSLPPVAAAALVLASGNDREAFLSRLIGRTIVLSLDTLTVMRAEGTLVPLVEGGRLSAELKKGPLERALRLAVPEGSEELDRAMVDELRLKSYGNFATLRWRMLIAEGEAHIRVEKPSPSRALYDDVVSGVDELSRFLRSLAPEKEETHRG